MSRAMPIASCLCVLALVAGCPGDDGSGGSDASGVFDPTGATDPATTTTSAPDPSTDGGPGTQTTDATETSDTTADGDATGGDDTGKMQMPPPTDGDALRTWLAAGAYLGWTAESAVHDSQGPHFGDVRTYVNDLLLESLTAGAPTHPVDAAAVKELYGNGATPLGWSVIVKVADGAGGDTWYFYEHYDSTTYGDGVGDGTCTGCHAIGSADYFKSPFPLQ